MKNLKGFTLIEVLICLAIVGIAAALVAPSVMINMNKKHTCTSLLKGYEATTNALHDIINHARQTGGQQGTGGEKLSTLGAIQIRDISTQVQDLNNQNYIINQNTDMFANVGHIAGMHRDNNYTVNNIRNLNGNALPDGYLTSCTAYKIGKQSFDIVYQQPPAAIPNNITETSILTRIYIDANGIEGPNRVGSDVFLFGIVNDGTLVPAGSETYNNNNIFEDEIDLYTDSCNGDEADDGLSCTARVMNDNWNINYR